MAAASDLLSRPLAAFAVRAALLSAPLLLLSACLPVDQAASETPKPKPVRVQTVAYAANPVTRSFAGTVRARIETDLAFRVGGKVMSRLVNVGDRVAAGQPIAVLDDTDLKLQADSAQAELTAARSALAQARADLQRITTLEQKGWASNASSDRQEAAADEAAGRVTRAERNLDLARNQLSYVTLTAEAAGVVTATAIEPGQVVTAGQAAMRVARLGEKEAVVALPEAVLGQVRDAAATVELWSEPGRPYRARLRELSPAADAATRTFAARFTIENPGDEVGLGMTATVTLRREAGAELAHLPLSALYDDGHGPSVWVVDADGALQARPVEVASYGADSVALRSGVLAGDKVVTLGVHKLDRYQHVRIVGSDG